MSLRKALYLLLCLSVYVISLLAFFPKKKANDYSLVSKDDYMGYLYYKTSDFYEKYDADSILLKDISFVFDMGASIDLTSINYEFMIIRQGVIYRGPFEENITVKNVPFIMDNNLTRINTISFALLDHTNKQVYTWYKKESYNLYKHDKYYIRLKDDGEFSLTSSLFIRQLQNIYKLIDN